MGYNTQFKGELKLAHPLTNDEYDTLSIILENTHLKFNEASTALIWRGSEKTYDLDKVVNSIIKEMQETFPTFELQGQMLAQGDRIDDRWLLKILDNKAYAIKFDMESISADEVQPKDYLSRLYKITVLKLLIHIYEQISHRTSAEYFDNNMVNQASKLIKDLQNES